MVTHFALGDQRKSSDLVIDLWCSIVSEHQKTSCSLCTGSHFDFVTYRFFLCMTYLLFDTSVYKCLTFPLHVPNTKTEQTPPSPFLDQKKITHCKFLKSGPLSIETGIFFIEMPGNLRSLNRYRWSTFICLLHNRAFVSQRYENVAVLCQ